MAELNPDLAARLVGWREQKKTVVFTNGVFDLMHPGHVAQLEAAKADRAVGIALRRCRGVV